MNDPSRIYDIYMAHFATSIVTIAITEFNIFTKLSCSPASVAEFALALKIDERSTEVMLDACVGLELLKKQDSKYFTTDLSESFLVKENSSYIGDIFELNKGDTYSKLRNAILSGKSHIYEGNDTWEKHRVDAKKVRFFTSAMHGISIIPGESLAETFDFSSYYNMLDIGGGSGAISIKIASRHSHIKGTLFDIPEVCDVADEYIAENNLQDRIVTRRGDIFKDSFPDGYDVLIMSNIIHDWSIDKCNILIEKSYKCLNKGGAIILNEALLNHDKSGPLFASLLSLGMLLWAEGRQYTGSELTKMLKKNGFVNTEIVPTKCYYSIVTGQKS